MSGGEVRAVRFMAGQTLIVACRCRERPGEKTYKADKEKPIYQNNFRAGLLEATSERNYPGTFCLTYPGDFAPSCPGDFRTYFPDTTFLTCSFHSVADMVCSRCDSAAAMISLRMLGMTANSKAP